MKSTKIKGVSVQSIIIGSVIAGVIALAGLAMLWPSVEQAKINTLAETLDEQGAYITSQIEFDYDKILTLHDAGDGDDDYLDELIEAGQISAIPLWFFQEPVALVWEIKAVFVNGRPKFYHELNSTNTDDLTLILKAIEHRGYISQ